MILLIFNTLLILLTAVFVLAHFGLERRVAYLLGLFIIPFAEIVLIFEFLSLFHWLTAWGVFIAEIILLAGAMSAWFLRAKPELAAPFRSKGWIVRLLSEQEYRWLFITVFAVIVLFLLVIIFFSWHIPDNFTDSIKYHLPKMAIWYQNKSIFLTPELSEAFSDIRLSITPPDSEMAYLWVFFWTGSDTMSNLVEVAGLAAVIFAIYGIGLELTKNRLAVLISTSVYMMIGTVHWVTFTRTSSSSCTAFILTGFYALLLFDRYENKKAFYAAIPSFALAFGTKEIFYYLLPILLPYGLWLLFKGLRREGFGFFLRSILIGLVSFILFASVPFIQSKLSYGGILTGSLMRIDSVQDVLVSDRAFCMRLNGLRYIYDYFVPEPTLGVTYPYYDGLWRSLTDSGAYQLDQVDCLESYFYFGGKIAPGWLVACLVPVAASFSLVRAKKRKDVHRLVYFLGGFCIIIMLMIVMQYHPSNIRYFAVPLSLFIILSADLFDRLIQKPIWLMSLLFLLYLFGGVYLYKNINAIRWPFSYQEVIQEDLTFESYMGVSQYLQPETEVVALYPDWHSTHIIAWGAGYTRKVYPATCETLLDMLKDIEPDYLIVSTIDIELNDSSQRYLCSNYVDDQEYLEALTSYLGENFDLTLAAFEDWRMLYIYQEASQTPQELLYPLQDAWGSYVTVMDRYDGLIGVGPLLFITSDPARGSDASFSLRAREVLDSVPVNFSISGGACLFDLTIYDQTGHEVDTVPSTLISSDAGVRYFIANLHLASGLNTIFIHENSCGDESGVRVEFLDAFVGEFLPESNQ